MKVAKVYLEHPQRAHLSNRSTTSARRSGSWRSRWGLVEEVAPDLDLAVEKLVKSLIAGSRDSLRLQKHLLQLWEEAPLSTSVAASIERFARAHG